MRTSILAKTLATILLFSGANAVFSQSKIDSLESVLATATGSQRAEALYVLSWQYRFSDKEKALRYGEEGLKLARELKDTTAIASSLNSIAETWLNFGDFDKAEQITKEELPYARAISNTKSLLGALTRMGTINYRRGKFDEALVYQLEVQREAEKINKPEIIGVASLNLGLTYMDLKRYDEAMQNFKAALAAFEQLGFAAGIGACYVNIAETLRLQKKYGEAETAAYTGEAILKKSGNNLHLAYIYTMLGKLYRDINVPKKRLEFQQRALALARQNQDEFMVCANQASLGRTFLEKGDFAQSKAYLDSALALASKIGEKSVEIETFGHLRDWYLLQKNFPAANRYDEQFTSGMDSVFNAKMLEKVADAQTKYETEKKEAEIAAQKLELFSQRAWIYGLLAGLLTLIVVGYLAYNRYRLRKNAELNAAIIREQQQGLNAVIEAQDAERKRIAQELHDSIAQEMAAIRLQFAALQHKMSLAAPGEAEKMGALAEQLDQSCSEVRTIAHVMMPPKLQTHGLAPSLELLLQNTLQHSGLQYEFDRGALPEKLSEKTTLGIYRIAQELLNNVVKHAKANKVMVMLHTVGNQLVLAVKDDGKGFDFEEARKKGSMGLLNVVSRVSTLQGSLKAEAAKPNGTLVLVRVPL